MFLRSRLAALQRKFRRLIPGGKKVKVVLITAVCESDSVSTEINGEPVCGTKDEIINLIRKANGIKKRTPYLILFMPGKTPALKGPTITERIE